MVYDYGQKSRVMQPVFVENKRQSLVLIGTTLYLEMGYLLDVEQETVSYPVIKSPEGMIVIAGRDTDPTYPQCLINKAFSDMRELKKHCLTEIARVGQTMSWEDFCAGAVLYDFTAEKNNEDSFYAMNRLIWQLRYYDVTVDAGLTAYRMTVEAHQTTEGYKVSSDRVKYLPCRFQAMNSKDVHIRLGELQDLYENYLQIETVIHVEFYGGTAK